MRRKTEEDRRTWVRPSTVQVYHAEPEPATNPRTIIMRNPWHDPMPDFSWTLPAGRYNERAFGYRGSKTSPLLETISSGINTGLFLESNPGTRVNLVEDGTVLAIRDFKVKYSHTEKSDSTQLKLKSVFVEGETGVVIYSGLVLDSDIKVGMILNAGESIGTLGMKIFKLELYSHGITQPIFWSPALEKPKTLLDPTNYLLSRIVCKTR